MSRQTTRQCNHRKRKAKKVSSSSVYFYSYCKKKKKECDMCEGGEGSSE